MCFPGREGHLGLLANSPIALSLKRSIFLKIFPLISGLVPVADYHVFPDTRVTRRKFGLRNFIYKNHYFVNKQT